MFHIFVVEDNPGDVQLLQMALKAANLECELTVVSDGGEAIEFVQRHGQFANAPTPHLAVLDLNLPKNDGLEILEAMRANEIFAKVPVAVLSSSSSPRELATLERFHVDRFIVKPPDLDQYLQIGAVIKELLTKIPAS